MNAHPQWHIDTQDFRSLARARLLPAPPLPPARARGLRPAAVLMPLLHVNDALHLLFTVRPAGMPSHAGEVCFPGGGVKAGEDALRAALREAREEVGIALEQVEVLGFCDAQVTGSGHVIAPLLGLVAADCAIAPCPREVAEVFTAPLAHFLDVANYRVERRLVRGRWRDYRVVRWDGHVIWGATAAILWRLRERLA